MQRQQIKKEQDQILNIIEKSKKQGDPFDFPDLEGGDSMDSQMKKINQLAKKKQTFKSNRDRNSYLNSGLNINENDPQQKKKRKRNRKNNQQQNQQVESVAVWNENQNIYEEKEEEEMEPYQYEEKEEKN